MPASSLRALFAALWAKKYVTMESKDESQESKHGCLGLIVGKLVIVFFVVGLIFYKEIEAIIGFANIKFAMASLVFASFVLTKENFVTSLLLKVPLFRVLASSLAFKLTVVGILLSLFGVFVAGAMHNLGK